MGSCYSSQSIKAQTLSPSSCHSPISRPFGSPQLPLTDSPYSRTQKRRPEPAVVYLEEEISNLFLSTRPPPVAPRRTLGQPKAKVENSTSSNPPPFTAVALKRSPDRSRPSSKTRKVLFKSPLTSPLRTPKAADQSSVNQRKLTRERKTRLLSRLKPTWRRPKTTNSHVQQQNEQHQLPISGDEVDAISDVEESLVVCLPEPSASFSTPTPATTTFAFTSTPATVSYIDTVDLIALSPSPKHKSYTHLVSSLFRRLKSKSQSASLTPPAATMASTTTTTTRPSALKPPSQLPTKLSSQFGFNSRLDKPPALPPKSSKLRSQPATHLPTTTSSKLLGSKSIGNVSQAPGESSPFTTTANSCDNLAAKPRSSNSDIASDSSPTLSSASSVSSFKKAGVVSSSTGSSRLPSARSGFFSGSASGGDSRFSNRSSSSSNISADSGHNSSSSGGPGVTGSKSHHNLAQRSNTQTRSFLPTAAKSHNSVNSLGVQQQQQPKSIPKPSMLTLNSHIPSSKPTKTAHIVSTPGPVIDRGAIGLPSLAPRPQYPSPTTQFPSITRFQQHQSQLHNQRLQFLYGAATVPNGSSPSQRSSQSAAASNTYPPTSAESNGIVKNGGGAHIAVPVTRRAPTLKSPPTNHGITTAEAAKPYKRPTASNSPSTPTPSPLPPSFPSRYPPPTNSALSLQPSSNGVAGGNSTSNSTNSAAAYYSASYVRNAVNRLNYQTGRAPPLPPKGIQSGVNGYARSLSHPPPTATATGRVDLNGNPTPAVPPKGLLLQPRNGQMVDALTRQTAGLNLKDPRAQAEGSTRGVDHHLRGDYHHHHLDLNGNSYTDSDHSGDYSSLTYNVRRRPDPAFALSKPILAATTNGHATVAASAATTNYQVKKEKNRTTQQLAHNSQQQQPSPSSLSSSSVVVVTPGRTPTTDSAVSRQEEMSFVAALVNRAVSSHHHQQVHQDDTDVEDELLMSGEDELSTASSTGSVPGHGKVTGFSCSPAHMSASICSTASTTSSFCFEANGSSSVSSGSATPGANRKVRTESSASCTTVSQESAKDWIDDEIADQPDLFMTSAKDGSGIQVDPGSGDHPNGSSLLPNRAHFHLNFHTSRHLLGTQLSPTKTLTPSMDDTSLTPTNGYPNPLRSANHELESLILQHSPRDDDYTSLPPLLTYGHPTSAADRSRSFSFNHANHQGSTGSTTPTTPNGTMSPCGPFGSPRVANLKKRHSYTAASSNNATIASPPHHALFRRPRPLSFVETADGNMGLDSPSLRAVSQDVIGIKTLLFRLQGVLQNAETQNPFESSFRHTHSHLSNRSSLDSLHSHHERTYSNCSESSDRADPETVQALREENFDLKQELKLAQEEMIDKDRTIRLLQQQMAKYTTGYVEPLGGGGDQKRPELTNSTTQTETCSTEDGINPRALSDGSNGQLVRFCCTHQMDLV